jgi:hypothetical protein
MSPNAIATKDNQINIFIKLFFAKLALANSWHSIEHQSLSKNQVNTTNKHDDEQIITFLKNSH